MVTPEEQWWDVQAAEYVIGTLQGLERDVYERILSADTEAQDRVIFWQNAFSSYDVNILEITPPEHLLPLILARISSKEDNVITANSAVDYELGSIADTTTSLSEETSLPPNDDVNTTPTSLSPRRRRPSKRSNKIWKGVAALATAASVALAALLLNQQTITTAPSQPTIDAIAVIQNEELQPVWIVNVDTRNSTVQSIAIEPPVIEQDQTHQLWIVKPNEGGVTSIGLLPRVAGQSFTYVLPSDTAPETVFAVSLEPLGGSPESAPTGPVQFTGSSVFVHTTN